jgi:cell division protein FtsL
MLEFVTAIICAAALVYHGTCILLNRNELKRLNALISSQDAAYVEKKLPKKPPRRATRLTDSSKKWLENKGKRAKEVS